MGGHYMPPPPDGVIPRPPSSARVKRDLLRNIFNMHFNSEFFIRRAFNSRPAHLFATTLGREMPEVKRSRTALCDRQETQCRADKKCSYIVNLWGRPSQV